MLMFQQRNKRIERLNQAVRPDALSGKRYLVSDLELFKTMGIGSA